MNASITEIENRENGFTALINRLRANPKLPLIVASSAAIAIVIALLLWAKSPNYQVLYTNLGERDGGNIVTELSQWDIPYRFAEQGGALLIPADRIHETRLRLAQKGLPKGGAVGFELLDQEKFSISQFSEQINYQRALEGELSRTIQTLGPVENVRVHLALPKPSLFVREQKPPTASVALTLAQGRALDEGQINAITHMVSSSVAGLTPGNVTVVDQNGNLLTQSERNGQGLNGTQLKFINEIETRYQRRIETILAPMVGKGNVHAEVTAQLDFSTREQTIEEYKPNQPPNQAAIRSQQLSQSKQKGGAEGGVPGALSNQPSAPPAAPIETPRPATGNANNLNGADDSEDNSDSSNKAGSLQPESSRRDETTNYEVDRTIQHIQQRAGMIQRLSVAVVVNYLDADKSGKPKPLTKDQLTKIENLTREAMGYSKTRGDSLNVVNTPFTSVETSIFDEQPFWQQPRFFDLLLDVARWLLLALVAWILWRMVVRPQLVKKQQADEAAAAQKAAVAAEEAKFAEPLGPSEAEILELKKSQQRSNAEMKVQKLRDLAQQDPNVVALVIHQWMKEGKK
jgi:flagellar M-ring protein FliF